MKKYKVVVCGGTFDRFHKGHKEFLNSGLSVSKSLIIGITSDEFVKKFKISNLKFQIKSQNSKFENFSLRKKNLEDFLRKVAKGRYKILKIDDMFGTTLDRDFYADAILVSENTKAGAKKINIERGKKGLSKFQVITVSQIFAEDGQPVSSFRIRNGEIDREGNLYIKQSWFKNSLFLPEELRSEFKKPLGKLITKINKYKIQDFTYLITVGDETTRTFNELSLMPNIAVVDFKVARKKKYSDLSELGFFKREAIEVLNPPGGITGDLFKAISSIFKRLNSKNNIDNIVIKIDGEEDLSVLPLILGAPLGSFIFYGQQNKGIVKVLVNEEIKERARTLVSQLITRGY